jgi:hypothetical protein
VVAELRRGINLAGCSTAATTAPTGTSPGALGGHASAGFTAVRLPVRWWGRTAELLAPVRELVDTAWSHGLAVVLTLHHADAVCEDPLAPPLP